MFIDLLTWLSTHTAVPLSSSPTSQMHTVIWRMLSRKRVRWLKQRSATTLPYGCAPHMQILSTIWPTLNGSKATLKKQLVSISRPWRFSPSLQQHIQIWHLSSSSRASSMKLLCTTKKPSGKFLSFFPFFFLPPQPPTLSLCIEKHSHSVGLSKVKSYRI